MNLNATERRLLNDYQRDFPLEPRPYARIAAELGVGEDEVLALLAELQAHQAVSRVGAVIRPNTLGASTLAAMAAPAERLEDVAALVSARPEINHNYEREHAFNLWFVVTATDDTAVRAVLGDIEAETGLPVIDLPLVAAYHIDLGFDLS
jgi:DNA-binding Lrp family transcriptional regulator